MPVGFDDEGEEEDKNLRAAIDAALHPQIDPRYHTEDMSDYETALEEHKTLESSVVSPWDLLIDEKERDQIVGRNIEIKQKCPYLQKARDSGVFYYCQGLADIFSSRGMKFSGAVAKSTSAEGRSRCNIHELKAHCVGDVYMHCEVYETVLHPKNKIPFSKE